jgi:hypothetical protein
VFKDLTVLGGTNIPKLRGVQGTSTILEMQPSWRSGVIQALLVENGKGLGRDRTIGSLRVCLARGQRPF